MLIADKASEVELVSNFVGQESAINSQSAFSVDDYHPAPFLPQMILLKQLLIIACTVDRLNVAMIRGGGYGADVQQ